MLVSNDQPPGDSQTLGGAQGFRPYLMAKTQPIFHRALRRILSRGDVLESHCLEHVVGMICYYYVIADLAESLSARMQESSFSAFTWPWSF